MSAGSRLRAASESIVSGGGARSVCDHADDDGVGKRAVRGATEPGRVRVLPERDDGNLSGLHDGDRSTAAEERKDGDNGSDTSVRHGRKRRGGRDDSVGKRDTGKLQPGEDDVGTAGEQARNSVPGCVLRRECGNHDNDDVHGRGQQCVRTVHEDDDVQCGVGDESAGGVQRNAVRRELRDTAGSVDLGSVLLLHAGEPGRDAEPDRGNGDERDLPGSSEQREPDHDRIESVGERAVEAVDVSVVGCGGELHISKRREDIPGVCGGNWRNESEPDDIAGRSACGMSAG